MLDGDVLCPHWNSRFIICHGMQEDRFICAIPYMLRHTYAVQDNYGSFVAGQLISGVLYHLSRKKDEIPLRFATLSYLLITSSKHCRYVRYEYNPKIISNSPDDDDDVRETVCFIGMH